MHRKDSPDVKPRQWPPVLSFNPGVNPVKPTAIKTEPDATIRFIHQRWTKGLLGNKPDGLGDVRPAPSGWQFVGKFLSSGREVTFSAPDVAKLSETLRGAGWLPYDQGMIGG